VDPLRCRRCRLHTDLCACNLLTPIPVATKVLVVAHWAEVRKPTNTGGLATLCLQDAELCLRGREGLPNDPVIWDPASMPLFLFPDPGAIAIEGWRAANPDARKVTLIVPDGTWRQAKRVRRRVPGLPDIQEVKLTAKSGSGYRLRHAHLEHRLATMEAIAQALGVLEGPAVEQHLMHAFHAVVDRTLWSNGRVRTRDVTGGIPDGARQDGPASR